MSQERTSFWERECCLSTRTTKESRFDVQTTVHTPETSLLALTVPTLLLGSICIKSSRRARGFLPRMTRVYLTVVFVSLARPTSWTQESSPMSSRSSVSTTRSWVLTIGVQYVFIFVWTSTGSTFHRIIFSNRPLSSIVAHLYYKAKHGVLDGHPVLEQGYLEAERLFSQLGVGS